LPPSDDPSWDLRDEINTYVLASTPLDWSRVPQSISSYSNLQSYLAASPSHVGFFEIPNDPALKPPDGASVKATYYYPLNVTDPEDPTYWGYWAEEWDDGSNTEVSPTSPKLASQVWIAGPQTPISVIDDLIRTNKNYSYAGNVIGGVGRDPILMGANNKIEIDIDFAAQSATAVIEFMTASGANWQATLTRNSSLFDRDSGYRYTIGGFGGGGSGQVKKFDLDGSNPTRNIIISNSQVVGHFYGNEAKFTGGRFQLDGYDYGYAVGVFKAKKVQD
jgi:hypothetical protein